ncbi:MAG: class II aldolase/adducin family protein [Bacteroidetes bacterium]|nr:class II aldolase/adducin family protein [Bacteroidota bacterium]
METGNRSQEILKELESQKARESGYRSWGKVEILEMAFRMKSDEYLHFRFRDGEISSDAHSIGDHSRLSAIFQKRKKVNCILITDQQHGSKIRETIPSILDDQAQLLGPSLRYTDQDSSQKIIKALSGRYAVNYGEGKTICIGRDIEETYIATQLAEKTAKAFIYAKRIGGAISINRLEAWAMHKFYMWKYSRIAGSRSDY